MAQDQVNTKSVDYVRSVWDRWRTTHAIKGFCTGETSKVTIVWVTELGLKSDCTLGKSYSQILVHPLME